MATKPKENLKAIKEVQQRFLSGQTEIKSSELKQLGFDLSSRNFTVRNIKFSIDIFGTSYLLSVIDKTKDLDGNSIAENLKLLNRIQTLWEAGKKKITNKELAEYNIYPAAITIDIGNVRLNSFLNLSNSFDFEVINAEKDTAGKWLDSGVTTKRVIDTLLKFPFSKEQADLAEVPLNKELEDFFKLHFKTVKKADNSNKGVLDLTNGSGRTMVALELKKANQICASNKSNECCGQIEKYHSQFGSNLILVVAGHKKDIDHKNVQACFEKAQKLGMGHYKMIV